MGTKFIYSLAIVLLLFVCDPNPREISFSVRNETNQAFKIALYENSKENSMDMLELSSVQILRYSALGGGFNAIADFDSIKIFNSTNNKKLEWIKPDNNYGYIDNHIGEKRDIQKDIYNRKNWTLQTNGDDEEWIFIINETDLELFE